MLLVQMLLAFAFFVDTTDYFNFQYGIAAIPGTDKWLPRWLRRLRLDSKKWLFRDPNCSESLPTVYPADYEQAAYGEEPGNYCGVLYNLLHPGWKSDSLDMISFVEDVYSLSITPFLLLVRWVIVASPSRTVLCAVLLLFPRAPYSVPYPVRRRTLYQSWANPSPGPGRRK